MLWKKYVLQASPMQVMLAILQGLTILHTAVSHDACPELVATLLSYGADASAEAHQVRKTCLVVASSCWCNSCQLSLPLSSTNASLSPRHTVVTKTHRARGRNGIFLQLRAWVPRGQFGVKQV